MKLMNEYLSQFETKYVKGMTISYTKDIMFKGTETIKGNIVSVIGNTLLIDNGDELSVYDKSKNIKVVK